MPDAVVIATISAFISVISVFVSARALRLTARKFDMERFKWERDYFNDVTAWAELCLDHLSEAVHLCDTDPSRTPTFFQARIGLLSKVSSLIDRGGFFFPNYASDFVDNKPEAYRGYRHEVLDALVEAYRLMNSLNYAQQAPNRVVRERLVEAKRVFTSQVQSLLDPRSRRVQYEKIVLANSAA